MFHIILGILLAFSAAYCIISFFVKNSVVSGDSKGEFEDFSSTQLVVEVKKDKVSRNHPI